MVLIDLNNGDNLAEFRRLICDYIKQNYISLVEIEDIVCI